MENRKKPSRRDFLKLAGAASGSSILAACAPAQPAATAVPPATAAPAAPAATVAPTAAATFVPTAPAVAKTVTIKYWYWADTPAIGVMFRYSVQMFNKISRTVKVEAEVQTNTAGAREKAITTATVGSGGPDVMYANTQLAIEFDNAGISRPVQDFFDKWPLKADMYPGMVETHRSTKGGKELLYMPVGMEVNMHHYRTDLYKAAGLQPPRTFDELVSNAKVLTKAPEQYGFGLRASDGVGFKFNFLNYLANDGVTFTDGKGGSDLDGPIALDMTKRLAQLYYDGIAQPSALQDRLAQMSALMQTGKIAQWGASINTSRALIGDKDQFDPVMGVCAWPAGKGKRWTELASAGNLMMKACKEPEAAWEWMMALTDTEAVEEYAKIVAFAPVLQSVAKRPFFQGRRWDKVAFEQEAAWGVWQWGHKNWNEMYAVKGPELWQRVLKKEITPETMLKQLADLMRAV